MYQVCRRLAGFEPHIVCIAADDYPDEEQRDGIFFHRIRMGRLYKRLFQKITRIDPWSYAGRAAALIDRIKPDIVHVHNAPWLIREIREASRWRQARYILHMQNEMSVAPLGRDEVLIADSNYLKGWYAQRQPDAKIVVVTNGVDTVLYQPAWIKTEHLRDHPAIPNLPADRKIILYVGRISPEKGPLDLVHAFRELLKLRQDVFLLLVGERRTGDTTNRRVQYGQELIDACERMPGCCRHVGVIDPAEIHRIYPLADLTVVPSEFEEPFGMVAIEAMAAGIPVLAANKGGLREFVIPHETGFLIADTHDHAGFARQMHELLDRPSELERVQRNARAYVEQHHGWETVTHQLETLYHSLLERT